MSEMVERVARAMQQRAKEPLGNIESLEPVLVGSLGDAWPYLARAAIEAMREPTENMLFVGSNDAAGFSADDLRISWHLMVEEALK